MEDLLVIAKELGEKLTERKFMLATAESCTGGQVAHVITSIPGSAHWFDRGFVTYSNEAKQEMLGVNAKTIEMYGAVSENTAKEMAIGAITHSKAQVSIAVTGIAGPAGGTATKPVGTICFAWAIQNKITKTLTKHFQGDRLSIRTQAAEFVLTNLLTVLSDK